MFCGLVGSKYCTKSMCPGVWSQYESGVPGWEASLQGIVGGTDIGYLIDSEACCTGDP